MKTAALVFFIAILVPFSSRASVRDCVINTTDPDAQSFLLQNGFQVSPSTDSAQIVVKVSATSMYTANMWFIFANEHDTTDLTAALYAKVSGQWMLLASDQKHMQSKDFKSNGAQIQQRMFKKLFNQVKNYNCK